MSDTPQQGHEPNQRNLKAILDEIGKAAGLHLAPEVFFTHAVNLISSLVPVEYVGVWVRRGGEFFSLCNSDVPQALREADETFQVGRMRVLRRVWDAKGPEVVEGGGSFLTEGEPEWKNAMPFAMAYHASCISAQGGGGSPSEGILEVGFHAGAFDAQALDVFKKFIGLVAAKLALSLKQLRLDSIEESFGKWQTMSAMLVEIAGEMDPERLSLAIATRGREMTDVATCAVFASDPTHTRARMLAVSNVEAPNPKSAIVQAMRTLAEHAISQQQHGLYRKISEKTEAKGELGDFFVHSASDEVLVMLLYSRDQRVVGTMIFEGRPGKRIDENAQQLAKSVVSHAGPSIAACLDIEHIPLIKPLQSYQRWRLDPGQGKKRRVFLKYGLPVLVVFAFFLLPVPFKLSFPASILPEKRMAVVVEVPGRIVAVDADGGQLVQAGQQVGKIDDRSLVQDLAMAVAEERKARASASKSEAQDNVILARTSELDAERAAARVAHLRNQIEKSVLRSPIAGTLLTYDLTSLLGHHAEPGQAFCEIGDLASWRATLQVPESDMEILTALVARSKGSIPVELRVASLPGVSFPATIDGPEAIAALSQTSADRKNYFPVTAHLQGSPESMASLKAGFTGKAKVAVGWRPVGYILLRRFLDFLRISLFF